MAKHWVFLFSPETYAVTCKKGFFAVGDNRNSKSRFFFHISPGDRFLGYVTQSKTIDCIGSVSSDAYGEEGHDYADKQFPWRRKVAIEAKNLGRPASGLLREIEPFSEHNTSPGNWLTIRGGFVEISAADFQRLEKALRA